MTDALGVLVETFNDLEASLEHLLLVFMESDMLTNLSITNEMGSIAKVHAIQSLMSLKKGKEEFGDAVDFALKSFETCRINRNNVVHFRFAWRKEHSRKTDLYRMRSRGWRISYTVTLKVGDLRKMADECHTLVSYFDELTMAVGNRLDGARFEEPQRPTAPKLLNWKSSSYDEEKRACEIPQPTFPR